MRDFLDHRHVYLVVCPRAHGLAVGVNMNVQRACNFNCVYCEVNREPARQEVALDVETMIHELDETLALVTEGRILALPQFSHMPPDLLKLRQVLLSGDGEPTLCPNFAEVLQAVIHLRALGKYPFFKIILTTNASELNRPEVQRGWHALTPRDEIWAKLDAGTEEYYRKINRSSEPFSKVLDNILLVGRYRGVVIQSLFARLDGQEPGADEVASYVTRLKELQEKGAHISQVQIYSALKPTRDPLCEHLPLKQLSKIAHDVRVGTGIPVEVF